MAQVRVPVYGTCEHRCTRTQEATGQANNEPFFLQQLRKAQQSERVLLISTCYAASEFSYEAEGAGNKVHIKVLG